MNGCQFVHDAVLFGLGASLDQNGQLFDETDPVDWKFASGRNRRLAGEKGKYFVSDGEVLINEDIASHLKADGSFGSNDALVTIGHEDCYGLTE